MSKAIEQFTAERDEELKQVNKHYSQLQDKLLQESNRIKEKAEKRIIDFYREHPDEIEDVLSMINNDTSQHVIAAFIEAGSSSKLLTVKNLLPDSPFSDNSIRTRIYSALGPYLDLLAEISSNSFRQACGSIEQHIADKKNIISSWKEQDKADRDKWNVLYRQMRQNSVTNQFNKISRLSPERGLKLDYEGKAVYTKGNITVGILDYGKLFSNSKGSFTIATKRLMDMTMIEFTSNGNNPSIRIPLDVYTEQCGLRDKKEARKQVNYALDVLFATTISYDDSSKKNKSKNYRDMRIIDDKGIKNGVIYVHFAQPFAEMLANDCSIMPYPLALLRLKGGKTCPYAYSIGRKMAEHRYMNAGKANERVIAIKTLVDACDDLPTETEVRNSQDRHLSKRITRPFLDSLEEACKQVGIGEHGYYFTYDKNRKISDEELYSLSYDTFINAFVHFDEWPSYPDQTKRIEARKTNHSTVKSKKQK